jgi:hypothetical protein
MRPRQTESLAETTETDRDRDDRDRDRDRESRFGLGLGTSLDRGKNHILQKFQYPNFFV